MGRGVPFPIRLGSLGSVVSSPTGGPWGVAPAENGFWCILKPKKPSKAPFEVKTHSVQLQYLRMCSDILISKTKTKMIDFSNTETKTNTKMIMKTETI